MIGIRRSILPVKEVIDSMAKKKAAKKKKK
jgi:hypothetical protein